MRECNHRDHLQQIGWALRVHGVHSPLFPLLCNVVLYFSPKQAMARAATVTLTSSGWNEFRTWAAKYNCRIVSHLRGENGTTQAVIVAPDDGPFFALSYQEEWWLQDISKSHTAGKIANL